MTITNAGSFASVAARERYVPRGLANTHSIFIARAEGTRVWDVDGREYLDFTSGIGVLNIGHRHPRVVRAVARAGRRLTHTCFQVAMYEPYVELAARLCAPRRRSDAQGDALHDRRGSDRERGQDRPRAHAAAGGGRLHRRVPRPHAARLTMTASNPAYRQNFGPFASEVYHAPYPDEYRGWTTERAMDGARGAVRHRVTADQVAAIMIEPQLGEGGFVPAPARISAAPARADRRHGIVLIVDEIQSGFGRTGRMFGYQHAEIEPDLVVMAKSLAGRAAAVGRRRHGRRSWTRRSPGGLGGTYAGNPLACAAALAVLDVFETKGSSRGPPSAARRCARRCGGCRRACPRSATSVASARCSRSSSSRIATTKEPDADLAQRVLDARARPRAAAAQVRPAQERRPVAAAAHRDG